MTEFKRQSIFIDQVNLVHNYQYDYSETEYVSVKIKIKIICKEHGTFYLRPDKHLEGRGCPACSLRNKSKSLVEFIKDAIVIHNNKYDYSRVDYKNNHIKIEIFCPQHGSFYQAPYSHLSGAGCWKCTNCVSNVENKWLDYLQIPIECRQLVIKINKNWYKVDACVDKNIYEFYGDFWHGNPDLFKSSDMNNSVKKTFGELYNKTITRENKLKSLGYKIISIWENDWNKLCK